ncbi:MAG TPA: histidine kinase, partial [Bacteroidia bacterium]
DKDYIYDLQKINDRIIIVNQLHNNVSLNVENLSMFFVKARSMCVLNDTLLLLGGWANNIYLARFKNNKVDTLKTIPFKMEVNKRNRVNCFLLDKVGRIWCGTDYGLLLSSQSNPDEFHRIYAPALNTQILDIIESNDGAIYIATNKGLFRYFKKTPEFIKELNNHPIEKINSLCKDLSGNIYVGTLNGLFKIKPNFSSEYFSFDDGLSSNEINKLVYNPFKNSVVIGTNMGISELNLYLKKDPEKHIPRVHFDDITSTGTIVFNNGVYELERRNVNILFSSICFSQAKSIVYKRVIDNNPPIFIENSIIELAAMNYGKHNIKIYASTDGKNWSQLLELNILIKTPFYFTTWFGLLSGTAFCFIIWLFMRFRIRKIKDSEQRKMEMEQKMIALKYEALNASINPHFIFNALNSVQHYINTNRNDEASDYLAKFGSLIRDALESASEHFIEIERAELRIRTYVELEQLRFNSGFTFTFEVAPDIDASTYKIPNMILQPLIENSIIHGFKEINYEGKLSVNINKTSTGIQIIIEDNGRGISDETVVIKGKTKSIGMKNVRERLQTIPEATFRLTSKNSPRYSTTGVRIEINLPKN